MANRRSLWLGLGLALTLAATWYAAGVDDAGEEPLAAPQRTAPAARPQVTGVSAVGSTNPSAPRELEAQRMTREGGDLFATLSWQPPPPPPAAVAPASPPRAPELPYRYLGRMEEDGRVIAFLAEGAQQLPRVVRQGDLLPNYRVDEITSLGMRLTYLPLNEPQRLLFGSTP
ncbi:hypothetical protein ASE11_16205 [Hydrogenophaga sp. Root209]|uniref:hypothetical protein n=1 Tax=Hydrogenophaga sp. Root209 TaxID=1736490 RepID=UPI0006FAE36D|nr:hypothetical protein [Hydrogenophaga sp. Root209]KRB96937.1 hypothetical protein ASE11_16205 [Hydrogenophaga sp. Root209]